MRLSRLAIAAVLLVSLAALWIPTVGSADGPTWTRPVNLSQSGSASDPALVADGSGQVFAFWWDQFDGLTVATKDGDDWQDPLPVPVTDYAFDAQGGIRTSTLTGEYIRQTISSGSVTADGTGGVAVFFAAHSEGSGSPALRLSRASLDSLEWSDAITLVSDASAWQTALGSDDTLHLVVFFTGRTETARPGVYYMRSTDGGATWSDMRVVTESLYVRGADPAKAHISLAAAPSGALYLAWNEPGTGRALWSWSADGGDSWVTPRLVSSSDRKASYPDVTVSQDGRVTLLWQGTGTGDQPALYASESPDGGYNWREPESVLYGLSGGSAALTVASTGDGRPLLVAGGQQYGPALALYEATDETGGRGEWTSPRSLGYPSSNAASVTAAGIESWSALTSGGQLTLAGEDESGDIWALGADLTTIEWAHMASSVWQSGVSDSSSMHILANAEAVSAPLMVTGVSGAREALWWDAVDGLVSAYGDGSDWYAAQADELLAGGLSALLPYGAQLLGDGGDGLRAFWVSNEPGAESVLQSSERALGRHIWNAPQAVAAHVGQYRAEQSNDGSWQVLFSRSTGGGSAAGIYYTRESGGDWLDPVMVASVPAGEPATVEGLDMDAGAARIVAAWLDSGAVRFSASTDGGASWTEPVTVLESVGDLSRVRVVSFDDRTVVLAEASSDGGAQLYQVVLDAQGAVSDSGALVPAQTTLNGQAGWQLAGSSGTRLVLVTMDAPGEIAVRQWQGDAPQGWWSDPVAISLTAALTDAGSFEAAALAASLMNDQLTLSAVSTAGQVGFLDVTASGSGWDASTPDVWSWPRVAAVLEADAGTPVVQVDDQMWAHVMWAAGSATGPALWYGRYADGSWTEPAQVVQPDEGVAIEPSLLAVGERLFAAWSGGQNGRVDMTGSYTSDAYAASSWPLASALPGPVTPRNAVAAHPALVADLDGGLYAVYAVPINQYRGIYLTRSRDGGQTWEPSVLVFDASVAGWTMVDDPTITVDHDGTIYVAWLRYDLAGEPQARSVYVTRSQDGGQTWGEARLVADGAYGTPTLALADAGQPQLLWQDAGEGRGVWQSYSMDWGGTWSLPMRVRGFSSMAGTAGVAADGQGALYLAGIGVDDQGERTILYATWDAALQQWTLGASLTLPSSIASVSDLSMGLPALGGELISVFAGDVTSEQGIEHALLYTVRPVLARASLPESTTAVTEEVGTVEAQATVAPTATAAAVPEDLSSENGTMEVGPLTVPIISIGGLTLVALLVAGVLIARGRPRR